MRIDRQGDRVVVSCPAKVNLYLEVLGLRPDGYHEIETVMQAISLYDTLELSPAEELTLSVDDPAVPSDGSNLVMRAALLLRDREGVTAGATMSLKKSIPAGGGLGGGSSDAAGALAGLCRLWNLSVPVDRLHALAAEVGSDVPFFLYGGTALCRGRGEIVTPLPSRPRCHFVLVHRRMALSTGAMYSLLDKDLTSRESRSIFASVRVDQFSALDLSRLMYNAFEGVVYQEYPMLREVRDGLLACGAVAALLSGSGATVFGVSSTSEDAEAVAREAADLGTVALASPEAVSKAQ